MWAEDNSGVYFNVDSEGSRNLYFTATTAGQTARDHDAASTMLTVADVGKTASRWACARDADEAERHRDVHGAQTGAARVHAAHARERRRARGQETRARRRRSGTRRRTACKIQGWIVKPPDFDPTKKYPLMLAIHGGPHAMYNVGFNFALPGARRERLRRALHESARQHRLRQRVRQRDQERVSGQGLRRPDGRRRRGDRQGYVDTKNMFVYGCTGGGVLTAWIVGHTDRFAAASSNCPVINWISFVGTTDGAGWYRNFEKLPWEDPSEHLRRSPLMYVGNVKTPTMLMTGVQRSAHADAADRGVLQALKVREGADGDDALQRRVARHQLEAVELPAHAAVLRSWFER